MHRLFGAVCAAAAATAVFAAGAQAQVPADLKAKIAGIGRVIDPPSVGALYRPLQPSPPYEGVTVTRAQSYGPAERNKLDVFEPAAAGGARRPVLIYVAGGVGDRIEQFPNGDAFYDNIMLWAVKNGMVGVNISRRSGPGVAWDDNAKDVAAAIAWVKQNIARHGGDPDQVFIWSHSAGNAGVATYIAHPEYQPAGGPGLKGAILMSGNVNVAPIVIPPQPNSFAPGFGPPRPPGAPPPPRPDPAVQLQRSNLPGLKQTKVPLMLVAAELDPTDRVAFVQQVGEDLCKAGRCPERLVVKDHDHMSIVFAINTPDTSASGPILAWMRRQQGR